MMQAVCKICKEACSMDHYGYCFLCFSKLPESVKNDFKLYQENSIKFFGHTGADQAYINEQEPPSRIPEFSNLLNIMKAIHEKKNRDYATDSDPFSNFKFSSSIGNLFKGTHQSFATLIGTKLARLASLLEDNRTPNNESIQDTFIDLTVYCALWTCFYMRESGLEVKTE